MKKLLSISALWILIAAMLALGSGTGGSGTTTACNGGSPDYCVSLGASQRMLRSAITYSALDPNDGGPAVGVPFLDPDTGTRITRVTDGMIQWPYHSNISSSASTFNTNSAAEADSCSNLNPSIGLHGGYLCWLFDNGNNTSEFVVDKTTLSANVIESPNWQSNNGHSLTNEAAASWTDPWAFFTSAASLTFDAFCNAGVAGIVPATPTPDTFCGSTLDAAVPLFTASAANCPNLPAGASGTLLEISSTSDDNVFEGFDGDRYIILWNRANGDCDWYDTGTGTVGGSGIAGVQTALIWSVYPAPASMTAPTAGGSGGTFTAGDAYCFDQTFVTTQVIGDGNYGAETTPGPEECTPALTAGQKVTLSRPPLASDWVSSSATYNNHPPAGWNDYGCQEVTVGTPCAPNVIQNTSGEIAWGTASVALSSLVTSGAVPPATDVGGFAIHQCRISPGGKYVYITMGGLGANPGLGAGNLGWITGSWNNWQASTAYNLGDVINDSNGNLETARGSFTSGSGSHPAWSTTIGGTASDNGGTWMMSKGATNVVNIATMGGHTAPGGHFTLYNNGTGTPAPGWNSKFEEIQILGTRPTQTVAGLAGPQPMRGFQTGNDLHPSWATNYGGADTAPFCASADGRGDPSFGINGASTTAKANGTMIRWPNSGFNPAWGVGSPGDGEMICEAVGGSGRVWRFGHHRSSYLDWNSSSATENNWYAQYALGSISHDGDIMIFTSSWDWSLGSFGHWSWAPNNTYTSGTVINDSNGNLETAQSSFTSGSTMPVWSTAVGGTTSDGGGTWKMSLGCPSSARCRYDVFVAELK